MSLERLLAFKNSADISDIANQVGEGTLTTSAQTIKGAIEEIKAIEAATAGISDASVSSVLTWSSDKIENSIGQYIKALTKSGTKKLASLPDGSVVSIPSPKLWYKADSITGVADGAKVATWVDDSGNGFDVAESSVDAQRPTYRANQYNGLPLVEFDQSGASPQRLYNNDTNDIVGGASVVSVFFVAEKPVTYIDRHHWVFSLTVDGGTSSLIRIDLPDKLEAATRRVNGETLAEINPSFLGLVRATRGTVALYEVVFDYANGTCKLYQDGRLIKIGDLTSTSVVVSSSSRITIGNSTSTQNTSYAFDGKIGEILLYSTAITDEETTEIRNYLMSKWGIEALDGTFSVEFETANFPSAITGSVGNLSLIATKTVNAYTAGQPVTLPNAIGYLYLDETTQKLYYSKGKYDAPEYLCDWNATVSGGAACNTYQAIITKDGDIIFLKNLARANPIIYPNNDYSTPVAIDFSGEDAPCGILTDSGIDHHYNGDYFMFGEYFNPAVDGNPIYMWKVVKPYSAKANWTKVKTMVQRETETVGNNPDDEIRHIHAVRFDVYTGMWMFATGDGSVNNYTCRIFTSIDEGTTWIQAINGSQDYRLVDMVFDKDYAYYASDTKELHALYRVARDNTTKIPDFAHPELLAVLGHYEPTYRICLMRNPAGLLMLDRGEARTDGYLDLMFWSFEKERLYRLGIFTEIADASGERDGVFGFGNQVVTSYQPTGEDGIICGAHSRTRTMDVEILNNTYQNKLGNAKIKVVQIKN